ncbi:unnamed protein product, partial [Chrysoparadoxa australica]
MLVDLAGSERAGSTPVGDGYMRFEELKAINLSLSALAGNCVSALSEGHRHVPFRDSKLTRLLQQSLGGNARTSVIVTLMPDGRGDSSQQTLRFAERALSVSVQARVVIEEDLQGLCSMLQQKLDAKADEVGCLVTKASGLEEKLSKASQMNAQLAREKEEVTVR